MEVSAEKTERTLFGARKTNLLSLNVCETALKEERAPKLRGLTMQPHKGLSNHVMCMKEAAKRGSCSSEQWRRLSGVRIGRSRALFSLRWYRPRCAMESRHGGSTLRCRIASGWRGFRHRRRT
ncbi:hypothetical protein TRVL_05415 [Trypanosoma vivax]|nr:hypothetical protein TRVL_05415 [Trypanosoma vivax]